FSKLGVFSGSRVASRRYVSGERLGQIVESLELAGVSSHDLVKIGGLVEVAQCRQLIWIAGVDDQASADLNFRYGDSRRTIAQVGAQGGFELDRGVARVEAYAQVSPDQ